MPLQLGLHELQVLRLQWKRQQVDGTITLVEAVCAPTPAL